jgi:hypothetical protein
VHEATARRRAPPAWVQVLLTTPLRVSFSSGVNPMPSGCQPYSWVWNGGNAARLSFQVCGDIHGCMDRSRRFGSRRKVSSMAPLTDERNTGRANSLAKRIPRPPLRMLAMSPGSLTSSVMSTPSTTFSECQMTLSYSDRTLLR